MEANYVWYENNKGKDRFGKHIENIHHNYYVEFDINISPANIKLNGMSSLNIRNDFNNNKTSVPYPSKMCLKNLFFLQINYQHEKRIFKGENCNVSIYNTFSVKKSTKEAF